MTTPYVVRECVHGHPIGKWNTYCKQGHTSNQNVVSKPDTNVEETTPSELRNVDTLYDLIVEVRNSDFEPTMTLARELSKIYDVKEKK